MTVNRVFVVLSSWLVFSLGAAAVSQAPTPQSAAPAQPSPTSVTTPLTAGSSRALINQYCIGCHNARVQSGKVRLDDADLSNVAANQETWERVTRKLRGGVMPPVGMPRPDKKAYDGLTTWLESELDHVAAASPNPGRTESFHRLNRTEYRNIVRDLLAIDMDFTDLLPIDDSGGGRASFDNIASSLRLSQSLMERYLSVAARVSRLAVGGTPPPAELTFKMSEELPQHEYIEGMPFGTRGGMRIEHVFPVDAEYELRVEVGGTGRGQIELTLDGA